jgi:arylsulfatase
MTANKGIAAYQGFLNDKCITIAEALKPAGYTTAMVGKWHVGEAPMHWPQRRGFENFYGIPQGGGAYFYPFLADRELWENDKKITPSADFYSTDAFSDYAVDFVGRHEWASKPFFLYMAYVAPHYPLQAKKEDIEKYRGKYKAGFELMRKQRFEKQQKSGVVAGDYILSPKDKMVKEWSKLTDSQKDIQDLKMAVYAAQMESMDRGIGRVVQKLEETGQAKNTLILFLSDNGGASKDANPVNGATGPIGSKTSWTSYGTSWANVSNTPYRSYKGYTHEGGIITPLIAYYPQLITKPKVSRQPGHVTDIMPTLLELAGAAYPKEFNGRTLLSIGGQSLVPLFKNQPLKNSKSLFWEHEGNRAVRNGNWKLVSDYPGGWELYDLQRDPTELNNLSLAEPDQVKKLELLYNDWAQRSGVIPWKKLTARKNKNKQVN